MANKKNIDFPQELTLYTGDGRYGDLTTTSREVEQYLWPIVRDLLGSIPFTPGQGPFVICDYGAADGINSTTLMKHCIDWVQETYGENQQVHIIYEDLPTNDFNTLFRNVEDDAPGSLLHQKNLFVTCCGRNFFKQCLPDASVHLGISVVAVMYSSTCPDVKSPEVFCAHFAEGSPEQRVFEEQSARDWETFLLCRAKELVPGGRLVIESGGRETCPCTGTTSDVWCLFGSMTDIWRDMMEEQLITEDEYLTTLAPWYFRTDEDLAAPFKDTQSRVRNSGLRLLAMETHYIKCWWKERWMKLNEQDKTAARRHASSFAQWIRTWANVTFAKGLSSERNSDEKAKLLEVFFERLADQVAMAPADRGHHRVDQFVTIAKTGEV